MPLQAANETATAASQIIAAALVTPTPLVLAANRTGGTELSNIGAGGNALAVEPPVLFNTATPNPATLDAAFATAIVQTLTAQPTPTQTPTPTPDAAATAAVLATEVAKQVQATLTAAPTPAPIVIAPPATPTPVDCGGDVAGELAFLWEQPEMGCPTGNAQLVWSAWTPYERGNMLWRGDIARIYGLFDSGWWQAAADDWDGQSGTPSRGAPPSGLREPTRGTGYVWGTNDLFFQELGWARAEEKGFCALIQDFEGGFLLRSSQVNSCRDNLYNRARDGDFPVNYLVVYYSGGWYAGLK